MRYVTLLVFLLYCPLFGQKGDTLVVKSQPDLLVPLCSWLYQPGDDTTWAAKDYTDAHWQFASEIKKTETNEKIVWFRKHIIVRDSGAVNISPEVIAIQMAKTYQIYWDGKLLGKSGNLFNEPIDTGMMIERMKIAGPDFSPGTHVLAIRVNNDFPRILRTRRIYLGTELSYQSVVKTSNSLFQFKNGFEVLAILLSMALFIGIRHISYLFFGLHRLGILIYTGYTHFLFNYDIPIKYNDLVMFTVYLLDPASFVFLSLFVLYSFDIPRKMVHAVFTLVLFVSIYYLMGMNYTMLLMFYSVLLSLWAVIYKRPGSIFVFVGLLLVSLDFNLPLLFDFYITKTILPDIVFVFFALLSMSIQVRHQEKQLHFAQNQNLRLESDLLKKNIQPHFLMNTLLTIISLIQTSPDKAIQLIRALADEFKIINKIAQERLIPLDKEVELCQKHLEIMGLRKSAQYSLVINDVCHNAMVPPMLFHTLIENGLTHAYEAFENGTFYLDCSQTDKKTSYVLKNQLIEIDAPDQDDGDEIELQEGFGIKYVKARLQESFPDKWELQSGEENGYWKVMITLNENGKR